MPCTGTCCAFVFSSHLFWTSGLWTYQPGSHTGGKSHRISSPSFCGACPSLSRAKDSAVRFPRRLWSRILYTNELSFSTCWAFLFLFLVRKSPTYRDSNSRPNVRRFRGYQLNHRGAYSRRTSSLPSCLWSLRIFPSLPGSRLTIFLSRCKFSTLQHAFRYERKNTYPTLARIEPTTSVRAGVQFTY